MRRNISYAIVAAAVVIVVAAVSVYYAGGYGGSPYTTTMGSSALTSPGSTAPSTTTQPAARNTTAAAANGALANATLFNSTQYYAHSYLISGSADLSASPATSDFTLASRNDTNGSTTYTIAFNGAGSQYNVTVGRGDSLYYIDTITTDDSGSEHYTGDDGYAVVSPAGYVVSLDYPISG